MKTFRTLEQAKKDLQVYLDYINLIEQYEPTNFVQHVIKEYAQEGNIIRTADILNRHGFRIEDRHRTTRYYASHYQYAGP